MGNGWGAALALLLLPGLLLPAWALTGQEAVERQELLLEVDELQDRKSVV